MKRWGSWLWLAVLGLLTGVTLQPAAPYPAIPGVNSAIFMYVGRGILSGQLPYRDLFDNKPPLTFYLNALGLALHNGSRWGIWVLQVIFVFVAAGLAFLFLRRYFREWIAGYAAMAFLVNLVLVLERGNLTEEYALPFQFAALWLFARLAQQKGFRWASYLFGASFSLALMSKQSMVGLWAALGLIFLVETFHTRQWSRLVELLRWAVGAVAAILPWVIYFAFRGILGDFWEVAFYYNFIYTASARADRLSALGYELNFLLGTSGFFTIACLAWLGGLGIALAERFSDWKISRYRVPLLPLYIALVDGPVELLMINLNTSNFTHYFMAILPAVTIFLAFVLGVANALIKKIARQVKPAYWALPLLLPVMFTGAKAVYEQSQVVKDESITKMVAYLEEETRPGDYVLTWGVNTQVNYLADRRFPTRFITQIALFREGYGSPARFESLLEELKARPPQVIIDTRQQGFPFVTWSMQNQTCGYDPEAIPAGLDKVLDFVCQNYKFTETYTKDQWYIYRPRKP